MEISQLIRHDIKLFFSPPVNNLFGDKRWTANKGLDVHEESTTRIADVSMKTPTRK